MVKTCLKLHEGCGVFIVNFYDLQEINCAFFYFTFNYRLLRCFKEHFKEEILATLNLTFFAIQFSSIMTT